MGEPIPQSHKRHFDFPFWPVESASELADYAEWLIDLVRQESGAEPEVKLDINLLGRDRESPIPLGEFRERFDEFPFDKIFAVSLDAWNPDETLTLEFRMTTGMLSAKAATVSVAGDDKSQVQRIKTRVREEGEARIARVREAKLKVGAELGEGSGRYSEPTLNVNKTDIMRLARSHRYPQGDQRPHLCRNRSGRDSSASSTTRGRSASG